MALKSLFWFVDLKQPAVLMRVCEFFVLYVEFCVDFSVFRGK